MDLVFQSLPDKNAEQVVCAAWRAFETEFLAEARATGMNAENLFGVHCFIYGVGKSKYVLLVAVPEATHKYLTPPELTENFATIRVALTELADQLQELWKLRRVDVRVTHQQSAHYGSYSVLLEVKDIW